MEKRRAARGYTHDPYECCGASGGPYGRPKGRICDDCKKLIADGKAAREKAAAEREAGAMQPYRYHEARWAAPHYYGYGVPKGDAEENDLDAMGRPLDLENALQAAIYELTHAVSEPAPATTPPYAGEDWNEPWPHVIEGADRERHDWVTLILLKPTVRNALTKLDRVIRKVLPATYLAGKAEGRNVLYGLAKGEVSMDDFDDALLTSDQRAAKQQTRRGY